MNILPLYMRSVTGLKLGLGPLFFDFVLILSTHLESIWIWRYMSEMTALVIDFLDTK